MRSSSAAGLRRAIQVDLVIELWRLLLKEHFALLEEFCAFVKEHCPARAERCIWSCEALDSGGVGYVEIRGAELSCMGMVVRQHYTSQTFE